MKNPLVSVIIPTYNRSNYLFNTIESIVSQTYKYLEIIIVDDGSTDETKNVVQNIISKVNMKNIIYVYQTNGGAPSARNNGLAKSRGEYIIFFDSDDIMFNNRVELQMDSILKNDADLCAAGFKFTGSTIKNYIPPLYVKDQLNSFLKLELWGSTQSFLFKKSVLLSVGGYDEELSCFQDIDLVFRILTVHPRLSIVPRVLTTFVDHKGERISDIGDSKQGLDSIFKSHKKRIKYLCDNYNTVHVKSELKNILTLVYRYILVQQFKKSISVMLISSRVVFVKFNVVIFIYFLYLSLINFFKGFIKILIKSL